MDSLTLLYDCKTKVLQRFFIAKNNKRKHRFLHVPQEFSANNILESNGIRIDLLNKSAMVNDTPVELTKSEYDLLLFFIGNKDRVISKSAMAEHLSGEMADMMDNHDFVYTHIKNLKAKLAAAGCKDCIKNVYGTGYKWTEL